MGRENNAVGLMFVDETKQFGVLISACADTFFPTQIPPHFLALDWLASSIGSAASPILCSCIYSSEQDLEEKQTDRPAGKESTQTGSAPWLSIAFQPSLEQAIAFGICHRFDHVDADDDNFLQSSRRLPGLLDRLR